MDSAEQAVMREHNVTGPGCYPVPIWQRRLVWTGQYEEAEYRRREDYRCLPAAGGTGGTGATPFGPAKLLSLLMRTGLLPTLSCSLATRFTGTDGSNEDLVAKRAQHSSKSRPSDL